MKSRQQRSVRFQDDDDCQEGNPLGASYSGKMNVTVSGIYCQVWAALQPHEHNFTEVGEHNFCRNPNGVSKGVWCYTTEPENQWEHCTVPKCALGRYDFGFFWNFNTGKQILPCVTETRRYGPIRDSEGRVETPHETTLGCEKSYNG